MRATIPVFAGLGSDLLFDDSTQTQALSDSQSPQGHILAGTCLQIFVDEIADGLTAIDRSDFEQPEDLLRPKPRYHHRPSVQHASLGLIQLLRYQRRNWDGFTSENRGEVATAGFCSGLFAAVAAATARGPLEYLTRAVECFRASLLLGIAVERSQTCLSRSNPLLPWSVVVKNIQREEINELIHTHLSQTNTSLPLYVSATNSASCYTISGPGDILRDFIDAALSEHRTVRPSNLYGLYHGGHHLLSFRNDVEEEFRTRSLPFPRQRDLICPIISTIDGSLIQPEADDSGSDLLAQVVDMILIEQTDWEAVQNSILRLAQENCTPDEATTVCNYGPGYGALTHRKDLNGVVQVLDVSQQPVEDRADDAMDIAIVGMGIDLPGAPDAETLWANLMAGKSFCSEIPSDRFHIEDYCTADGGQPLNASRSMGSKYGNFLEDPFLFDPELFGISPREAPSIDPQQRLMLQAVHRALESAGYVPDATPSWARETFGCFVGNATLDYVDNLKNSIDVYYSPGTLRAFLSGRISYAFKWSGPSITVDTACSSSLTALHHAARALNAGDCRAAVVGGVNVMSSPEQFLGLDRAHFLSPTGQCKSFDAAADGYCRSEGCAVFVLKRLSDAVGERDRILGVIRNTAVNQSGNANSITHPHSPTQERLFHSLLAGTGIRPHDVGVVEAHGTGTQAGDPNELRSIRATFNRNRSADHPLHVGSIKANIGHCEAASGAAALAKLLLMLRHRHIPPQALLENLNPAIDDLAADATIISRVPTAWPAPPSGGPRIALLNNFGAAGSNAALLLQEAPSSPVTSSSNNAPSLTYPIGISARSPERLTTLCASLADFLSTENSSSASLADVAYTLTARRVPYKYRISFTASSLADLTSHLRNLSTSTPALAPTPVAPTPRPTVFLFSGQGSQYPGMGASLAALSPRFRQTLDEADRLLQEWGFPSCKAVVAHTDGMDEATVEEKDKLQAWMTGVFVLEVGLADVLIGAGIRPAVVTGHSLGEYAALVTAGVLDFKSGLWLVAERARLIVEKCEIGATGMLAVNRPADMITADVLGRPEFGGLEMSCENSQNDCVVGGKVEVLERLKTTLTEEFKAKSTLLKVPVAYHTSALDPVLKDLRKAASRASISPLQIPIASNTLGRVVYPGENVFTPEYFAEHCRKTVAFDHGIADVLAQEEDCASGRWIEIGPQPQLLPMVSARLARTSAEKLPALKKDKGCDITLADIYATFYCDAVAEDISWRDVFHDLPSNPQLIDLPLTPMIKERYFVPLPREVANAVEVAKPAQPDTPYTMIEHIATCGKDSIATYETSIQRLARLIKGHIVCGQALCPGSVYGEMALAAAVHASGADPKAHVFKIADISFTRPLLYTEDSSQIIRVVLKAANGDEDDQTFEISTTNGTSDDSKLHCSGKIKRQSRCKVTSKLRNTEQALARRKVQFTDGSQQSFMTNIMYKIFGRVVDYSDEYRAVQKIYMDENAEEVFAECKIPTSTGDNHYAGEPVLLDTMLHVAGFAMNLNVDNDSVCICHSVHSSTLLRKIEAGHAFDVHCSNFTSTTDPNLVMADAHAVDSTGVIAVIKGMHFRLQKLAKIQAAFDFAARFTKPAPATPALSPRSTSPSATTPPRMATPSMMDQEPVGSEDVTIVASDDEDNGPDGAVIQILSDTTGIKTERINSKTELAAIGVDSMMIFEIEKKITDTFALKLVSSELSACDTVEDIELLLRDSAPSRSGSTSHSSSSSRSVSRGGRRGAQHERPTPHVLESEPDVSPASIALLQARLRLGEQPEVVQARESALAPLYLVHPGAGMCHEYYRIGALDRIVRAVHDPRIFTQSLQDDWASISDMAQEYAAIIHDAQRPTPPPGIILGGYSFGGIVAFEAARLLSLRGDCPIRGVVMIDAPPPSGHIPIARKTIDAAMSDKHGPSSKPRSKDRAEFEAAIGALAVRNNLRRAALLGKHRTQRQGPMPRVVLLRSSQGFRSPNLDLPENEWLHDRTNPRIGVKEWEDLIGSRVDCFDIPGDHFTPFETENLAGTTAAIRKACRLLDSRR